MDEGRAGRWKRKLCTGAYVWGSVDYVSGRVSLARFVKHCNLRNRSSGFVLEKVRNQMVVIGWLVERRTQIRRGKSL